jgi:hypothetical protein
MTLNQACAKRVIQIAIAVAVFTVAVAPRPARAQEFSIK